MFFAEECVETWNLRKKQLIYQKQAAKAGKPGKLASPAQHHNTTRQTYIKHKQKKKEEEKKKKRKKKAGKCKKM